MNASEENAMNYNTAKDLMPLQPYIAEAVRQIRADWNRRIGELLKSEDFGLTEAQVYQDLCNTLLEAKFAAYERYRSNSGLDKGRRIGFVSGYTQSALDTKWKGLYLLPQLKEYRDMMWLSAILNCLRMDRAMLRAVSHVQRYLFETGSGKYQMIESALVGLTNDFEMESANLSIADDDLPDNLQQIERIFTEMLLVMLNRIKEFEGDFWIKDMDRYFPSGTIEKFVLDI